MKKWIWPVILLIILISGCTSTGLFGVITTNEVLEKRLSETENRQEAELEQVRKELLTLVDQLEEIHKTAEELNSMIDTISATEKSTRELQEMARIMETRLNNLPRETLAGIIDILNKALEE